MIKQNNISFDTYFGRILDPITTANSISLIDNLLKNRNDKNTIKLVYSRFLELCINYIESDKITSTNKSDAAQQYYIVISYLFDKIITSNAKSLKEVFNPTNFNSYVLLKKYLIPFLNLVDEIHQNNIYQEFNSFCYSYLLSGEISEKSIYIIENINQPTIRIIQVISETLNEYLKKNELILTLTGCLFYKHEKKTGLFTGWLEQMGKMRKEYIRERDKHVKGSDEYNFFNARQQSTKVAMNSSYGLFGQSTYRYSNNWLAKTITCQGRLSLKISQQIAEDYLKNLETKSS